MFKFLTTIASKVPFLGTAVSWVMGNTRTIIEYALVSVTMAIGGTALTLWFKTKALEDRAELLQGNLITEQLINSHQSKALQEYEDLRQRDAFALQQVVQGMGVLTATSTSRREKLATLEKNDALVRDLLNTPVPPSLNCLHNPTTCNPAGDRGEAGKASPSPVPVVQ